MDQKKLCREELERAISQSLPVLIEFKLHVAANVIRGLYGMSQMIQEDQIKNIRPESVELMRVAHERGAWAGRLIAHRTIEFTPAEKFDMDYFLSWVEPAVSFITVKA